MAGGDNISILKHDFEGPGTAFDQTPLFSATIVYCLHRATYTPGNVLGAPRVSTQRQRSSSRSYDDNITKLQKNPVG